MEAIELNVVQKENKKRQKEKHCRPPTRSIVVIGIEF